MRTPVSRCTAAMNSTANERVEAEADQRAFGVETEPVAERTESLTTDPMGGKLMTSAEDSGAGRGAEQAPNTFA
jgi:hypothetical protein